MTVVVEVPEEEEEAWNNGLNANKSFKNARLKGVRLIVSKLNTEVHVASRIVNLASLIADNGSSLLLLLVIVVGGMVVVVDVEGVVGDMSGDDAVDAVDDVDANEAAAAVAELIIVESDVVAVVVPGATRSLLKPPGASQPHDFTLRTASAITGDGSNVPSMDVEP